MPTKQQTNKTQQSRASQPMQSGQRQAQKQSGFSQLSRQWDSQR